MFYCFKFCAYVRFFAKVLIETNVNISNKLNCFLCLSKSELHRVVAKFT